VIARFVDIGGIADHNCSNFLTIICLQGKHFFTFDHYQYL